MSDYRYKCFYHMPNVDPACPECQKAIADAPGNLPNVTRVEVHGPTEVDHQIIDRRRTQDIDVSISLQDDGRTLKVFVKRREGGS